MNRRGLGFGFCAIAAFLFASRFICAAIYGSGNGSTWSASLFENYYGYVGSMLTAAALASLVVGVAYIVWGELSDSSARGRAP